MKLKIDSWKRFKEIAMRKPVLAVLAIVPLLACPSVRAADEAKDVVTKAIKAYGGEAKLSAIKASQESMKGKMQLMGLDVTFEGTSKYQLPDQLKVTLDMEIMNNNIQIVQVFNKNKGWMQLMGKTVALEGAQLEDMKEDIYGARVFTLVPLLKDKAFEISLIGDDKVMGKAAVGIKVKSKGHKEIDLYFDKKTGLMVKSVRQGLDAATMQEVKREIYILEHKDKNGLKYPVKIRMDQDGKKFMEVETTSLQLLDGFNASEFKKPE